MNPNKEARIQQLESEIEHTLEKIDNLEIRVQTLESANERLESRVLAHVCTKDSIPIIGHFVSLNR